MTRAEAAKEFWQKAKERSKEVDQWPAWRRLETTHRRDAEYARGVKLTYTPAQCTHKYAK